MISCQKAKVNSTVQVNLSGVCIEDKHPEGEMTGCVDSILQQLHCDIIWTGTPKNISSDNQQASFLILNNNVWRINEHGTLYKRMMLTKTQKMICRITNHPIYSDVKVVLSENLYPKNNNYVL